MQVQTFASSLPKEQLSTNWRALVLHVFGVFVAVWIYYHNTQVELTRCDFELSFGSVVRVSDHCWIVSIGVLLQVKWHFYFSRRRNAHSAANRYCSLCLVGFVSIWSRSWDNRCSRVGDNLDTFQMRASTCKTLDFDRSLIFDEV